MSDEVEITRVREGDVKMVFTRNSDLPDGAQLEAASESAAIVRYESNPLNLNEGRFIFGRAGLAKVVLTWRTKTGDFIDRHTEHFLVQPAHWQPESPEAEA